MFHKLYLVEVCSLSKNEDGSHDCDEMAGTVMVDANGYVDALYKASGVFKKIHPEFRGKSLSLGVVAETPTFETSDTYASAY